METTSSGAVVTFNASWDVWAHGRSPMELYGDKGALYAPDPNFFGGEAAFSRHDKPARKPPKWEHPFAAPNQVSPRGPLANGALSRCGLADMALAILEKRLHRCSLHLALHAVEAMTGILKSGETGKFVAMRTTCERLAALGVKAAKSLFARRMELA